MDKTKTASNSFSDFTRFEGNMNRRMLERDAFIHDLEYVPNYDYPRLDFLLNGENILDKKRSIYESVAELTAYKELNSGDGIGKIELDIGYYEVQLKKIMLVEAARCLRNSIIPGDIDVTRREFDELNEALYGKFNAGLYLGILTHEIDRLDNFKPLTDIATKIRIELAPRIENIDTKNQQEINLLDDLSMRKLHDYVTNRYMDILKVVPDTNDDVYYDVGQCIDVINRALDVGGLSQYGWVAIERSTKSNPTTATKAKQIQLPSNTRRNAKELRRLIIHEQEVHARRSQNAEKNNVKAIRLGTIDYAKVEEGLAVILECAVEGNLNNPSLDRARNRYITAGLALGTDGRPRDAREVYEILWRMIAIQNSKDGVVNENDVEKAKNNTYAHIENAYRGTQFWMKGVIYTKLKVYYEGLIKNAEYFKLHVDNLDGAFGSVFIGKYNHTDPIESKLVKGIAAQQQ